MSRYLDPQRELQDWLADGPTSWSDQSIDAVIRRIAVTPQRRQVDRRWSLRPRRVLYAVAGLAAAVVIVAVAWSVLSGQLLPTNLPPAVTPEASAERSPDSSPQAPQSTAAATPEASAERSPDSSPQAPQSTPGAPLICHWDLPGDVMAQVERAAVELGVTLIGPDYAAAQGDMRLGVKAFADAGCDLVVARVTSPEREASAAEAFAAHLEQRGVVFGYERYERYQGRDLPNVLWVSLGEEAVGQAVFDAIGRLIDGTFQGGTLRETGFATPAPPFTGSRPPAEGPFSATGLLAQRGGSGDSVLLPDGRVLILNRSLGMGGTRGTQIFDPVNGTAELTGQPAEARFESTATLLRDGRVLVVGGVDSRPDIPPLTPISSAETWDPATESFTSTGSMAHVRRNHTATLLADGRVLVVGGASSASAEVWDPATGLFSPTGPLAEPRAGHTATVLPDGRVLVVGGSARRPGQTSADVSSAEVWDPATGLFSPAGALSDGRGGVATLLPDGRVLIAGDQSADIWDPLTNSFSPTGGESPVPIVGVAVLVPDDRVFFFGDDSAEGTGSVAVQQWDPASGEFSVAPSLTVPIRPETAAVLDDGRVLVIGYAAAVVYDPRGDE